MGAGDRKRRGEGIVTKGAYVPESRTSFRI
jgi:hypothetical protein